MISSLKQEKSPQLKTGYWECCVCLYNLSQEEKSTEPPVILLSGACGRLFKRLGWRCEMLLSFRLCYLESWYQIFGLLLSSAVSVFHIQHRDLWCIQVQRINEEILKKGCWKRKVASSPYFPQLNYTGWHLSLLSSAFTTAFLIIKCRINFSTGYLNHKYLKPFHWILMINNTCVIDADADIS